MKYFLDTEFIESFHKPLFGKRRHFIDLISIGVVAEDGREYYAISNEYSYNDADNWVRENVITPIYVETVHGDNRNKYNAANFNRTYGRPNDLIAKELLEFFRCWRDQHFFRVSGDIPEIYGYYADYDWVLLCSLFGRMIDLPKGFPMYCKDLRQTEEDKRKFVSETHRKEVIIKQMKEHPDYPKQINEHNALADAKWNYELYKFLTK
jgi:hypothetical protein